MILTSYSYMRRLQQLVNWNHTFPIHNAYLKSVNVSATSYRLVVCHGCGGVALPSISMFNHLNGSAHRMPKHLRVDKNKFLEACRACDILDIVPPLPETIVPQVYGLPCVSGHQCTDCSYVVAAESSIKTHFATAHKGCKRPTSWPQCDVQRLAGNGSYFKVTRLQPSPASQMSEADSFHKSIDSFLNRTYDQPQIDDPRMLHPFLRTHPWHDVLSHHDPGTIIRLASSSEEPEYSGVSQIVLTLVAEMGVKVSLLELLIRQRMVKEEGKPR